MNRDKVINDIKNKVSELKKFVYPDYPDLEINSKQQYRNVISRFFNGRKDFSYMYFDVDKLSIINNVYGKESGDKLLKCALTIIKYTLPQDAIINRLAGDEFCVILPKTTEEQAKEFCTKIDTILDTINSILKTFNKNAIPLTITSAVAVSSLDKTIDEIEEIAENKCSINKQIKKFQEKNKEDDTLVLNKPNSSNISNDNNWNTLNSLINNCMKEHLRDIRLSSDFVFNPDLIKQEAFSIVSILGRLIETNLSEKSKSSLIDIDFEEEDSQYTLKKDIVMTPYHNSIILDLFNSVSNIDTLLSIASDNSLSSICNNISELSDSLIRDPYSGLLSKSYLKLFLTDKLCNTSSNYQAIYFSAMGIRPSNSAYDHTYTDMRISKTAHTIIKHFGNRVNFNNQGFSFNKSDSFLIDQGGGNYLALIPSQYTLDKRTVFDIVSSINADVNPNKTNSIFPISFSIDDNIDMNNKETFMKSISNLKAQTNKNKNVLKQANISSLDIQNSLKKSLFDCARFYVNNIEDPTSIVNKNIFLTNIFSCLLHHQHLHNEDSKIRSQEKQDSPEL